MQILKEKIDKSQIYTNQSNCIIYAAKSYEDCLLSNLGDKQLFERCSKTFALRKQRCKVQYYKNKASLHKY